MISMLIKPLLQSIHPLYYIKDGIVINGPNPDLHGYASNLYGNCSGLKGYCDAHFHGDCSNLSGDCTGIKGLCSYHVFGNLDNCQITEEERARGIDIIELVKQDEQDE